MTKHNRISVSSYSESFYNFFASVGLNRTWLSRSKDGEFNKTPTKGWRLLLFIFLRINVYLKLFYVVSIHFGAFGKDLDFFENFGVGIWIALTYVNILSEYYYLTPFPCFETLCTFWNVQSEIFEKLSIIKREVFKSALDTSSKRRTIFHMTMASIAMIWLTIQYTLAPKGNLFTGSWLTDDAGEPLWITLIFGLHEEMVLFVTWVQAVSVILIPVIAGMEMTICLRTLANEINDLAEIRTPNRYTQQVEKENRSSFEFKNMGPSASKSPSQNLSAGESNGSESIKHRFDFERPDSGQSKYTIDLIMLEYKRISIVSDRLKNMSSLIMLMTIVIYFGQISSDVFVGIKLMQFEAYVDVGFYAADCTAGMTYWFVSLNCMSRLEDALGEFNYALRSYFRQNYPGRKANMKEFRSFRRIGIYVGPCPVLRCTVGTCMFILVNYYILAAMWLSIIRYCLSP